MTTKGKEDGVRGCDDTKMKERGRRGGEGEGGRSQSSHNKPLNSQHHRHVDREKERGKERERAHSSSLMVGQRRARRKRRVLRDGLQTTGTTTSAPTPDPPLEESRRGLEVVAIETETKTSFAGALFSPPLPFSR